MDPQEKAIFTEYFLTHPYDCAFDCQYEGRHPSCKECQLMDKIVQILELPPEVVHGYKYPNVSSGTPVITKLHKI